MKKKFKLLAITMALAVGSLFQGGLAVKANESATANVVIDQGTNQYGLAYEALDIINEERAKEGLGALQMDEGLLEAAMLRSVETRVYMDHTRPDGRSFGSSIKDVGSNLFGSGEVITFGKSTAAQAVKSWMTSTAGHRDILMKPSSKSLGMGVYFDGSILNWVGITSWDGPNKVATLEEDVIAVNQIIPVMKDQYQLSIRNMNTSLQVNESLVLDVRAICFDYRAYHKTVLEDLEFSSSNSAVASVDAGGKVTRHTDGLATITVKNKLTGIQTSVTLNADDNLAKDGTIKVRYKTMDGLAIATEKLVKGVVGRPYSISPKEIKGYSLSKMPSNASGDFINGTIIVDFYYSEEAVVMKEGTVTVHYQTDSGELLGSDASMTGEVGASYVTTSKIFDGYKLKTSPANANGLFIEGNIDVIYIYEKIQEEGTIQISYVDESGKSLAPTEYKTGVFGTTYVTSPKEFEGYTLVTKPSNSSGVINSKLITVIYEYRKDDEELVQEEGTIQTSYIDEAGKAIASNVITTGVFGTTYTTYSKEIEGYTLVKTPTNASGVIASKLTVVVYEYKKNVVEEIEEGIVQTKYIDETGHSLVSDEFIKGEFGTVYTTASKEIEGYTLIDTPSNASGVIASKLTVVVYEYKKNVVEEIEEGIIQISYIDGTGNSLAGDEFIKGDFGTVYTTASKEIAGYTLIDTPTNASGIIESKLTVVVYTYAKTVEEETDASVTVNYKDIDGNILLTNIIYGKIGETYVIKPIEIEGYTLVEGQENITGVFGLTRMTNINVSFVYKKNGSMTTPEDLNLPIVKETLKDNAISNTPKTGVNRDIVFMTYIAVLSFTTILAMSKRVKKSKK